MLNTVLHPARSETDAPPLLIVHGLFGSARNWGAIARRLSEQRAVIAVDQRNHGDSPWTQTHDYPGMAADLAEVIEAQGGPMDVLGHSMGGKAAMMLALTRPELVRHLIVADIAPVAYAHSQDHALSAMRDLDLAGLDSRGEADRRMQPAAADPGLRAFLLQSLDLKAAPPRWKLNLPVLEAEMPRILGFPEAAGQFDGRALFLSGAESHYVRPEHRDIIRTLFPQSRFAKLPGAGHWLHAEKPQDFAETAQVFLNA